MTQAVADDTETSLTDGMESMVVREADKTEKLSQGEKKEKETENVKMDESNETVEEPQKEDEGNDTRSLCVTDYLCFNFSYLRVTSSRHARKF